MLKTRVIPALLLSHRKLVKTRQFKNAQYVGDPINAIKIYNEKEVDELVCLDITATLENKEPDYTFIEQIASECFMPLAYGGGIKTIEQMKKIFSLGVEKIIINTEANNNPQLITQAAKRFGNQSVVVSIDTKKNLFGKYTVYTESGKTNTKKNITEWAKEVEKLGAGEILLTSITNEGTWQGFELENIRKVTQSVNVPVIANGGAGAIEDFTQAVKAGASAVAIGSMAVYQGKNLGVLINFPQRSAIEKALSNDQEKNSP